MREWPQNLFHYQFPRKNVAGPEDQTHNHQHTRQTRIRPSYHSRLMYVTKLTIFLNFGLYLPLIKKRKKYYLSTVIFLDTGYKLAFKKMSSSWYLFFSNINIFFFSNINKFIILISAAKVLVSLSLQYFHLWCVLCSVSFFN